MSSHPMSSPSFSGAGGGGPTALAPAARRLELTVDPDDGSLRTVPLLHVLLSTTDNLYTDLHSMTNGEINVATTSTASASAQQQQSTSSSEHGGASGDAATNPAATSSTTTTKLERMTNLSFAQRRHELSWRLCRHAKSVQHASAMAASQAASLSLASSSSTNSSTAATKFPTTFGGMVSLSSQALKVARSAWRHADEAQDALYFFHAQLFPSRQSPHDVYGACDVLLPPNPTWHDLPHDMTLLGAQGGGIDRYAVSTISEWNEAQVDSLWRLNVHNKLVKGEMGWMARLRRRQEKARLEKDDEDATLMLPRLWWKSSLRGGVLTLTHNVEGRDDEMSLASTSATSRGVHPITAVVTVLSAPPTTSDTEKKKEDSDTDKNGTDESAMYWTLLSINVTVKAKTGEFQHQLETNKRQQYDLHRLCMHAMAREESRYRLRHQQEQEPQGASSVTVPARPLDALFQVSHAFLLSWQLELLSAQALSLRRGAWNASLTSSSGAGSGPGASASSSAALTGVSGSSTTLAGGGNAGTANEIYVTPVQFFDETSNDSVHGSSDAQRPLGAVSVSFWRVDDTYGPPSMGDVGVAVDDASHGGAPKPRRLERFTDRTNQLTLSIRATLQDGIIASLSGFTTSTVDDPSEDDEDVRRDMAEVDRAAQVGIQKAICDPLALSMSDALLAATRWCADRKCRAVARALHDALPPWIVLAVERGCVAVAASVHYFSDGKEATPHDDSSNAPVLFRLACDARTGSFVACFARECHLLRELVGNSITASEPMALRIAGLPTNRRRAAGASGTGRAVRDAFQGLLRSMNLLGQRVGVGGSWDDLDDKSSILRDRSIRAACADVKVSLVKACGMAALYGLGAVSMGAALGLDAVPDMAGDAVTLINGVQMLSAPPISVLADQELVETSSTAADGSTRKDCYLSQSLFSMCCSVSEDAGIVLYALDVRVKLESPSSPPQREGFTTIPLIMEGVGLMGDDATLLDETHSPPAKRTKLDHVSESGRLQARPIMEEATRLAEAIANAMLDPSHASR